MNEQEFMHKMNYARAMKSGDQDYWAGYMAGLRRSYHGEKFGNYEHEKYLSLVGDPDVSCDRCRAPRGRVD